MTRSRSSSRRAAAAAAVSALAFHAIVGWLLIRTAHQEQSLHEPPAIEVWVVRPPPDNRESNGRQQQTPVLVSAGSATKPATHGFKQGFGAGGQRVQAVETSDPAPTPSLRLRRKDCLAIRDIEDADAEACDDTAGANVPTYEVLVRGRAEFDQALAERSRPPADPLERVKCEIGAIGGNLDLGCPAH